MDTMADRLVERPGAHAVRSGPSVRVRGDVAEGIRGRVHGVDERWSPARPGSGEPGSALLRPPGRSPVQPLDSPLATGPSARTRRLPDHGLVGGTDRGPATRSTRGSS